MMLAEFGKLEATVDSGAAITAFPKKTFQAYLSIEDSNIKGRTASGEWVDSEGIARVGVYTEDGSYHEMKGEVMDVKKILVSVSAMVDLGHEVIFSSRGSHVLLSSGKKIPLKRVDGVFTLPLIDAMRFRWQDHRL